jgi:hypothetical protein
MANKEHDLYSKIKLKLEELFRTRVKNVYLEITANKGFSNTLKSAIPKGREIVFNFLKTKGARPDITGFIKVQNSSDLVIVEVKTKPLKLDDIYQTRKYMDLLGAKFTFLISLESVPEEIKRLSETAVFQLLMSPHYRYPFVLAQYDLNVDDFLGWYPINPFEKDLYWQSYAENQA